MNEFEGTFHFNPDISMAQMRLMDKILGTDIRDSEELMFLTGGRPNCYHINLTFNEDFSGLEWDGSEKTRDLDDALNLIATYMEHVGHPIEWDSDSVLYGHYPEYNERTVIKIVDGKAKEITLPDSGDAVTCPECGHNFKLEEQNE